MGRDPVTGAVATLFLDSEGLSKLARGDARVQAYARAARERGIAVSLSAVTLAEVLRGNAQDAAVHFALRRVEILPADTEIGRRAGELLGTRGLPGHQHAIDAMVAATAMSLPRPVMLLTSDPKDLAKLTEEPGRPTRQRVVVLAV